MLFLLPPSVRQKIRAHQPLHLFVQFSLWVLMLYWTGVAAIMLVEPFTFTQANLLIWQTYLTIGYGNKLPDSDQGLWILMGYGLVGVAMMSALIGAGIAVFTYYIELSKGGLLKNPHKDGYVIFNFPGEGNMLELVRQLRISEQGVPICIVDNRLDELPLQLRTIPHLHFIRGELTRPDVYDRAGLASQKAVAVLPLDRNDPNSDAATASAVRMIGNYLRKAGSDTRLQHMLVDPDNAPMFEDLPSQEINKRADILILVQEFQGQGTAKIIELMLRNDTGDDLQMFSAKYTVGMTWKELRTRVLRLYEEGEMSFTLIALHRTGQQPMTRPSPEEVIVLGDKICVLAENGFDWRRAELAITSKQDPDHARFSPIAVGH